ncbi:MAG: type II toxin-antitoxin system Phd/YefM family antitoxin [Verrucomicrobiales bacterium]
MITVDMHDAKTRLSQLVKAVEEQRETVILQRNRKPVALIVHAERTASLDRDLTPDPRLMPILAPGYDAAEPLSEEECPSNCR